MFSTFFSLQSAHSSNTAQRRRLPFFWGMAFLPLLLVGVTAGCKNSSETSESSVSTDLKISPVALRIVSAGGKNFDQRLETAWRSVSEQPIEITSVAPEQLMAAGKKADIIVFPNQFMGDLQIASALLPIPETVLSEDGLDVESILPALSTDFLPWGTDVYSVPLGGVYPAVWYADGVQLPAQPSWDDYSKAIAMLEKGQAAEPLADGWAAVSFLMRSATLTREMWLFDRQSMTPQIASEPYVKALQQLMDARQTYPDQLLSPQAVWKDLTSGTLKVAVAWPTIDIAQQQGEESDAATTDAGPETLLTISNYPLSQRVYLGGWVPGDGQPLPPMLPPHGLSVGIAQSCRQTQVARAFLSWLASREGHANVRSLQNILTPHRLKPDLAENEDGLGAFNGTVNDVNYSMYDEYIVKKLSDPAVRPTLRIPGAARYLEALNEEVLAALEGTKSAAEALESAAKKWDQLTDELGRRSQINAWRQSQGMRER